MRLHRQLAALSALLIGAGSLAGTAWTRESSRVVSYTCPGGEQFTVEYFEDHVRLRTGAGIFALTAEKSTSGAKYSDGYTVLSASGDQAVLERPDLPESPACSAIRKASL
ncbi:MliC family protein [Aromatoleum toluolicum]|uniref:C-type lysozyme inhibitor domain-containing protein n=1 Tax=Aromatoleum toluolicum TaxID=90060 RepID=A0ABX1NDR9_9RHOO|nr:MliC family protein [Aromatoleum toluolicum]NMF97404.1 MliC family protein [Aromatoleum toluolicum]